MEQFNDLREENSQDETQDISIDDDNEEDSVSNSPHNYAGGENSGKESPTAHERGLSLTEQLTNSTVALETINNTRMAIARLVAVASQQESTEKSQDMVMLQKALYNLQHQQVMQMRLIQQLQSRLAMNNQMNDQDDSSIPNNHSRSPSPNEQQMENKDQPLAANSLITTLMDRLRTPVSPNSCEKTETLFHDERSRTPPKSPKHQPDSVASSVIKHNDVPPTSEPNTLEMLQKTANDVLNNASMGLITH